MVAHYLLMNSLSLSLLGIRNEAYLNEARKCCYKAIIWLEEVVTSLIDAPFSEYEEALAAIENVTDESRYELVRKIGFAIDSIEEGFGENSKWKWSFVELEGRFAAVTRNLLNLKTLLAGMDPRVDGLLRAPRAPRPGPGAAAAGRGPLPARSTRWATSGWTTSRRASTSSSPCAGCTWCSARPSRPRSCEKKAEIWKSKMEDDLRKAELARKCRAAPATLAAPAQVVQRIGGEQRTQGRDHGDARGRDPRRSPASRAGRTRSAPGGRRRTAAPARPRAPQYTAIARMSRTPRPTAVHTAARSAQMVSPYERFSTFVPVITVPSAPASAAPTGKREYGDHEAAAAPRAAPCSFSSSGRSIDNLTSPPLRSPPAS